MSISKERGAVQDQSQGSKVANMDPLASSAEAEASNSTAAPAAPFSFPSLQEASIDGQACGETTRSFPLSQPALNAKPQDFNKRVRQFLAASHTSQSSADSTPPATPPTPVDDKEPRSISGASLHLNGASSPSRSGATANPSTPGEYKSPFALLESPTRRSFAGAQGGLDLGPGASSRLSSYSGSLRSEPSLPWADPGFLDDMKQNSMKLVGGSRRFSEPETQAENDTCQPRISNAPSRSSSRFSIPVAPLSRLPTPERVASGTTTTPPMSPFNAEDELDDNDYEDFEFSAYGSTDDTFDSRRVSIEHQFSGLSSLSQSELAMVMALTDELNTEPEAVASTLSTLDIVEEMSQKPSERAATAAVRQAVLETTMNRLKAVLPPDVAQHLPPIDAAQVVSQGQLAALREAAASAQQGPPPPFAEPLPSKDLDKVAAAGAPAL